MSTMESGNRHNEEGRKEMENRNLRLERFSSSLGWGLFFILIGTLFFAQNKGWLHGEGWSYFAIGLGSILVMGFLVRYFGAENKRWSALGGLVIGLALVCIGIASIYGFGDWWPLVLIPIGVICLVKAFWGTGHQSYSH
jgi:peptidoglycan/LPS O-acetylase OafA/YrhL